MRSKYKPVNYIIKIHFNKRYLIKHVLINENNISKTHTQSITV